MSKDISVRGNGNITAGRDITLISESPFKHYIEKIVSEEGSEVISETIEEINEHLKKIDSVGLEEKLILGDRLDLVNNAVQLKTRFRVKMEKEIFSQSRQELYAVILSKIISKFRMKIQNKLPSLTGSEADELIYDLIIEPVSEMICHPSVGLDERHVEGMLYFLTGRCHLRW